jgi:hypothetical protein
LFWCFVAPLGDGEDSGPRLLRKSRTVLTVISFEGAGSGRTSATSAAISADIVAINTPSALISVEVESFILLVLALWWINSLSIFAKRISCPLLIVAIRASFAAMC